MFYISINGEQIYKPLDDLLIIFNPKLTLEIGKAGSLEFDIPPKNPFYDKLNQLTTEVEVDMDDEEIFHGRVLSNERAFNNLRHVYCEGDLSYLIDSVQKGIRFEGTTHELFELIISRHNARVDAAKQFAIGTVNIEDRPIVLIGHSENDPDTSEIDYKQIAVDSIVDNWNNSFDYIQTCLIDYCGGYLRTRRENGVNYIDLLADFENTSVQPIELGRNLLNLTEEVSVEDLFTVLIPLGDNNLTIASVNGGSDELVDREAAARFGRIVRTHVFNNVTSASTLLDNARRYLATNVNVPRTITVRAIDLHLVNKNIDPIRIGDRVAITSFVHEVDDTLTCTKIEYDLERPENNNYVFGNPKQSLTERYREDTRHEADTYGNSASIDSVTPSSIGSVAASSAGAIGAASAMEQTKALNDFYDEWIHWEPGSPKMSLGSLTKEYIDGKEVLLSECGIDLDSSTGNINIHSLHNQVDEYGRQLASNEARIDVLQTDTAVAIESVTERVDGVSDRESRHYTEITQRSDELGSSITSLARDINEYEDRTTTALASITQRADDQESRISATATYATNIEDKVDTKFAAIDIWANDAESAISMKADKLYVDAQIEGTIATFEELTSGLSIASKLRVTELIAGSISYWDESSSGPVAVPSMKHSHLFTIVEGENGNVEFSIAGATTEIPQKQSFNIANTRFYRDNVAAKTVKSFDLDTDAQYTDGTGYRYETANKRYLVYIKAVMSDDSEKKGGPLYVNARSVVDAATNAGAETATVSNVILEPAGTPTWDSQDEIWTSSVRVHGTARGTKADGSYYSDSSYDTYKTINVTTVYNAGKAAGSITINTIDLNQNAPNTDNTGYRYETANKRYLVYTKANLSDSTAWTSSSPIYIPAGAAWNSGKDAGAETATVSNVILEPAGTPTWDSQDEIWTSSVRVHGTATGRRSDGTDYTNSSYDAYKTINVTSVYNAGKAAGSVAINAIVLDPSGSTSSLGYDYDSSNNRYLVYSKANLSDGTTYFESNPLIVPAGSAWNAGRNSGAETAYFSNAMPGAAGAPYYSSENQAYYSSVSITGTARGTRADGTYYTSNRTITKAVDVSAVWDAAGGNDSVVVSISGAMSSSSTNRGVITATGTCGSKSASGTYQINLTRDNSTSSSIRVKVTDSNSNILAYTTVTYPTSTVEIASVSLVPKYDSTQDLITDAGDGNIYYRTVASVYKTGSSTAIYTGDANVKINAVYEFMEDFVGIDHGKMLDSTGSGSNAYDAYDSGYNFAVQTKAYKSGNYNYTRIGLYNSFNQLQKTIRAQYPAITSITSNSTSTNNSDYHQSGGRWKLYVHAKSGSTELLQDEIDVQFAVDWGAAQGGGSGTAYSFYCTNRSESSAGRITCDLSISSYSNLPFYSGSYYSLRYG